MEDLVEINNKAGAPVAVREIEKEILKVVGFLRQENVPPFEKEATLSVAFVGSGEISGLNLKYRKKNEPTDVLAFSYGEEGLSGEIILCYDIIEKNAKESEIDVVQELRMDIVHGILHVGGFEHGEDMFELQKNILEIINGEDQKDN